jgi:hypothetical protein
VNCSGWLLKTDTVISSPTVEAEGMFFLVLELTPAYIYVPKFSLLFYLFWNFLAMPLYVIVAYIVAPKQKWKRRGSCHRTGLAWRMWNFQSTLQCVCAACWK